jgi:predicted neutral ceramidase superfamily lipid hydrolase
VNADEEQRDATSPRMETKAERLDRNLTEMVSELRVALPGVQVLFAFLLVVPFNQRFTATTPLQRQVYFATLLLTAAATVFLIAPSVHHRMQFRRQEKESIVLIGNGLAVIGLTLLALAMVGTVLFVTDFLVGGTAPYVAAGATAALFLVVWYLIPAARRRER